MSADEPGPSKEAFKRPNPLPSCKSRRSSCKARRLRCDRKRPCTACVDRRDEVGCVSASEATTVRQRRDANENERLRSEVERLQRLVDVFISTQGGDDLFLPTFPQPALPSSAQRLPLPHRPARLDQTPADPLLSHAPVDPLPVKPLPAHPVEELEAQDVVRQLSELTLKAHRVGPVEGVDVPEPALVVEAQHLLSSDTVDATPSTSISSFFPASSSPSTTEELVARVPSARIVRKAVDTYFRTAAWYIHPITRLQYQDHEDVVLAAKEANEAAPPFSLAICFAIWASGLLAAEQDAPLAGKYSKDSPGVALMELAREALAVGRFLEAPTLDSIRALVFIFSHYVVYSPGEDLRTGLELLGLAVQGCLQLQLHRDPDKLSGTFSVAEAEDRRRLFWMVFLKDVEIASVIGRRFALLHLRNVDCRLPLTDPIQGLDQPESEDPTSPLPVDKRDMSFLTYILKLAKLTAQITEVFGILPVSYDTIMAFDGQLRDLESGIGQVLLENSGSDGAGQSRVLFSQMLFKQELLRLHRPYLAHAFVDPQYIYSRSTCRAMARDIVELHTSTLAQTERAGNSQIALQATVVLCVELLYGESGDEQQVDRRLVEKALERFEQFRKISTICRRGAKIIRFLLDKTSTVSQRLDDQPVSKRIRLSAPSQDDHSGTSSSNWAAASISSTSEFDALIGFDIARKPRRGASNPDAARSDDSTSKTLDESGLLSSRPTRPLPAAHRRPAIDSAYLLPAFPPALTPFLSPDRPVDSPYLSPAGTPSGLVTAIGPSYSSPSAAAEAISALDIAALLGLDATAYSDEPVSFGDFELPVPPSSISNPSPSSTGSIWAAATPSSSLSSSFPSSYATTPPLPPAENPLAAFPPLLGSFAAPTRTSEGWPT
ncbi:hypothetical protein JCM8097_009546 [Rhodosporidiobolus ruineniae]